MFTERDIKWDEGLRRSKGVKENIYGEKVIVTAFNNSGVYEVWLDTARNKIQVLKDGTLSEALSEANKHSY